MNVYAETVRLLWIEGLSTTHTVTKKEKSRFIRFYVLFIEDELDNNKKASVRISIIQAKTDIKNMFMYIWY